MESIEGYQMTDPQKYRMRLVRAHMDYITSMKMLSSYCVPFRVLTVTVQSLLSPKLVLIWLRFPLLNAYAVGRD